MASVVIGATRSRLLRLGDMIRSLHVSLGSASVGCRHLEWLLSHLCVLLPLVLVSDGRNVSETLGFGVLMPSVVLRGGWKSFSTWRVSKTSTLPVSKGLNWLSTASGELVTGKFFPSKSGVSVSDGCIIATRLPTILPSCVKATHRWEPGRVLGLRIQIGQGCSQLDLYVLNS